MKSAIYGLFMVLLAAGMISAQGTGQPPADGKTTVRSIELPQITVELKDGEGRSTVETNCAICHSTDYITMQPRFTRAQWTATVTKMIKTFGAPVSQEHADRIVQYLVTNYGSGK